MKVIRVLLLFPFVCSALSINQSVRNDDKDPFPCAEASCKKHLSIQEKVRCCSCEAKPFWNNIGKLNINTEQNGTRAAIINPTKYYEHFIVEYQHGELTTFPDNTCSFTTIVKIDFYHNRIKSIGTLTCLQILDTLILSRNRIQYLSNETFIKMKYIRVIDLSYNELVYIEPGFLLNMDGNLYKFNVSQNALTTMDVTNALWTKQPFFCWTDFSHNKISLITNELNWACEHDTDFGYGGFVDMSHNQLHTVFDYTKLGLANIMYLGKLLVYNYGFDFRWNPWICDCKVYPFAKLAKLFIKNYMYDYFNVSCSSPLVLKGVYLEQLTEKLDLMADRCPPKCNCFYQPHLHRTVVNCSNKGINRLPSDLPDRSDLDVDLSNNSISGLDLICPNNKSCMSYLKRIIKLDLSYNKIETFPSQFILLVSHIKVLRLDGNNLRTIPRAMQVIHACNVFLGRVQLHCTCDDIWIQNWLPEENACSKNSRIFCINQGEEKSIFKMTRNSIGCEIN